MADQTEQVAGPTPDEIKSWKGFRLDEMAGSSVGKVEGCFVDDVSGRPEWLLARMGRFGHYCLVPARDAVGVNGHVWVPYGRDLIRQAPRVDQAKPLERDREQALLEHYGVASAETGRGAELAKRGPNAVTIRPG